MICWACARRSWLSCPARKQLGSKPIMRCYSKRKGSPRVRVLVSEFDRKIVAAIAEAIKACRIVEVTYQSRGEPEPRSRRLAPYGLLTGIRRYLVARRDDDLSGKARLYVVENIRSARVSADPFTRDPEFNLQDFARRSFGVFQHPVEYGEVVWRFSPKAAAQARGFEFHPSVRATRPGALLMIFSGRLNTRCRALRKSG